MNNCIMKYEPPQAFRESIERQYPIGSGDWFDGYVTRYEYTPDGVHIHREKDKGQWASVTFRSMAPKYLEATP